MPLFKFSLWVPSRGQKVKERNANMYVFGLSYKDSKNSCWQHFSFNAHELIFVTQGLLPLFIPQSEINIAVDALVVCRVAVSQDRIRFSFVSSAPSSAFTG